jgi:hypothetical protein
MYSMKNKYSMKETANGEVTQYGPLLITWHCTTILETGRPALFVSGWLTVAAASVSLASHHQLKTTLELLL